MANKRSKSSSTSSSSLINRPKNIPAESSWPAAQKSSETKPAHSNSNNNGAQPPIAFKPTVFLQLSEKAFMPNSSHSMDPNVGMVSMVEIQEGTNVNDKASSFIQRRKLSWVN